MWVCGLWFINVVVVVVVVSDALAAVSLNTCCCEVFAHTYSAASVNVMP